MVDELKKPIEVVPYNPEWPKQFEKEAQAIKKALGDFCIAIHHVGSTSVPGLVAKPKIDIIGIIKKEIPIQMIIEKLEPISYEYRGEYNIPFHLGLSKRSGISVNLHVFEDENPEIELNLLFRDYLRTHPEAVQEYAKLKMELLKEEASHQKQNSMYRGYTLNKDTFIRKILNKAGFNKLRFTHCTHPEEWQIAKCWRQNYFSEKHSIIDPYGLTFDHAEHYHFVLHQGTEMVAYAHIQRFPENSAVLKMIVVDKSYQHKGYARELLGLLERWLKLQGIQRLQVKALPTEKSFYANLGFVETPFNDPDEHELETLTILEKTLQ